MKILFTDDGGAGAGGAGGGGGAADQGGAQGSQAKTYSENEFNELKTQRDNLKSELGTVKSRLQAIEEKDKEAKDLLPAKEQKIKELEQTVETLSGKLTDTETKLTELDKTARKVYLDQLSDEHKKIAKLIPTVEGLAEYAKLNATTPAAGQDAGRSGGTSAVDYSNMKWDDLSFDQKEEMRTKQPELWKKAYKEKYGTNP